MAKIDQAIERLRRLGEDVDFGLEPVISTEIDALAKAVGCRLPADYVEFLKSCGFAFWSGHAVRGIQPTTDTRFPSSYCLDAARETASVRALESAEPYPHFESSLVLEQDGMGGYFLLISEDINTPDRVMWVNREETWVTTNRWASFADYLLYQLGES